MSLTSVVLEGGARMPSVGLGLWKIELDQVASTVVAAIQAGYRHLDGASDYGNEVQAGEGVQRAIRQGLCSRDDLWITSKLWNTFHRAEHVSLAAERSLRDWGLDYFDLYLIHFPIALAYVPPEERYPPGWIYDPQSAKPQMLPDAVPIAETWEAMEDLQRRGLVRNIGISNFNCALTRDLLSYASVRPAVLQVESHPYLVQPQLLRFCQEQRIAFTAFSPLGAGSYVSLHMATPEQSVLREARVLAMAERHGKTAAQIVLRWGIQRGTAIIPKTSQVSRLRENLALFDFELTAEEMKQINSLNRNHRFNDPGVFCEQAFHCFYPIYE